MSAEFLDARAAEQLMWQEEQTLPYGVLEAERIRQAGGHPSGAGVSASPASPAAPRWPTLLMILLARLRGEQPLECCFLCLTSDDPKDCCAEHHDRLERIMHYGEAA